ncbi:tetratricopeptide repeat protein [Blastopirellula marina]|uniref:Uncharacterized protein n=1 Tax=Blastopirellula marina TaxID=124 RepID=A0A2S8GH17_9BACT|nr:tetratricopeptide repeat protein [Blastopirellula marina]PQO43759.1 hypothetical protein C5Y93_24310 [Blastopirellula marina]
MSSEKIKRANLLVEQCRYQQAADLFLEVLAETPEHPVALATLGWCQTNCGYSDQGEANVVRALQLAPDDDFIHQVHALCLGAQGRYAEGEAAIRRALAVQPTFSPYLANLAIMLRNQGKAAEAIAAAQQGLEVAPENIICVSQKMVAQIELGHYDAVEETIRLALRIDPEYTIAHAAHGYLRLHRKEYADAADAFREALRIDPHLRWSREGLTQCLKQRYPWYAKAAGFRLMTLSKNALRWYVMFAGLILYGLFRYVIDAPPRQTFYLELPLLIFFPTVLSTFTIEPLALWVLTYDREGKHLLLPMQRQLAGGVVGLAIIAICAFVVAMTFALQRQGMDALSIFVIALSVATPIPPLSKVMDCDLGFPRDTIWKVVGIASVVGLICLKLALASRAGMFPLEVNYYSGLVLIIVNLATLGASTLLPAMRFARSPIR